MIKKVTPQGNIIYTWSSSNCLIQVDDQIKQIKVSYTYDGNNNRIARTMEQGSNITETQYLVDNERPFSEIAIEHTRVNGGVWEESTYLHTPDGVGDLLTQTKAGQMVHLYQDGQGSTRLVTNSAGTITETHSFDAFGNQVIAFGQIPTTTDIKHLYVGEYFDQEANLYHMMARDYSPATGRFTSMDEFEGSQKVPLILNKYLYSNADSINKIDPSGYFSLGGMMSGVGNMAINTSMAYMRMEVGDMIATTLLTPIIASVMSRYDFSENSPNVNLDLPGGNLLLTSVTTGLATMCVATKGKRCYIRKIPLLATGSNLPAHATDILAATTGFGNTLTGASGPLATLLVRKSPPYKDRNWLKKTAGCAAKVRGNGRACDEYPYASTWNGGPVNYYRDKVSTTLVPGKESTATGLPNINKFYVGAKVSVNRPYLNIGVLGLRSFYIDQKGKLHPL